MESLSHSPLALLKVSLTGLQSQTFWGLFSQCWGAQSMVQASHTMGRTSAIIIILSFVGYPFRSMGLGYIMSPSFLPTLFQFPHYIFSCRISFLLVFLAFSSKVYCIDGSVQFNSVAQSCATLCDPMNHSTQGLPVHHHLRSSLRLTSIKSVMPSSHLILGRPLLLLHPIPPNIRVFSNESTLRMRWTKY